MHQLGRGAMGTVYLAEDTKLSRRVAIKVLLPVYVGAVPPAGVPAWDWDRTWRTFERASPSGKHKP